MKYPPRVRLWEILLRPSLWMRLYDVDQDFDRWLSEAMDRGEPLQLGVGERGAGSYFYAVIGGVHVGVLHAPCADATTRTTRTCAASRRTALRFRRAIAPLLWEQSRFRPPVSKVTA